MSNTWTVYRKFATEKEAVAYMIKHDLDSWKRKYTYMVETTLTGQVQIIRKGLKGGQDA